MQLSTVYNILYTPNLLYFCFHLFGFMPTANSLVPTDISGARQKRRPSTFDMDLTYTVDLSLLRTSTSTITVDTRLFR